VIGHPRGINQRFDLMLQQLHIALIRIKLSLASSNAEDSESQTKKAFTKQSVRDLLLVLDRGKGKQKMLGIS